MLLSIITPYYDTLEYTLNLAKVLVPQLTREIEWIIIDDGCNEQKLDEIGAKVIHLPINSGNASVPRNVGLDNATGKYITFIDSDDMVSNEYIKKILEKINEGEFDYCIMSWRTKDHNYVIRDLPPEWNTCVWNCVYNRNIIGETRFDPKRNLAEDKYFNKEVRKGRKKNIVDIIYFYNWQRPNSISSRYREGKIKFNKE